MTSLQPNELPGDFVESAVARHQAPLLRYASRLLGDADRARDVVQDTFIKLMAQKPESVAGHEAEWLFTVCRHGALDILRKEGRMKHFEEGETERLRAPDPRPGEGMEREETRAMLLTLMDRLPARQQELLRLKFLNGFSYKQISRITALSVSNVGFLIHSAVTRLRREFAAAPK